MLSKIYHCKSNRDNEVDTKELLSALSCYFLKRYSAIKIFSVEPKGTLGRFFRAVIEGKEFFIKTHLKGDMFRNALINETLIYSAVYSDYMYSERIDIDDQVFLVMDKLSKLSENPSVNRVKNIIIKYSNALTPTIQKIQGNSMYTLEKLYQEGLFALVELESQMLISKVIHKQCLMRMEILELIYSKCNHVICHGDLSNKNIMLSNNSFIAIDWEDCFIGIPNYDLCYWLTFFDQRKYYAPDLLSNAGIPNNEGVAIMLLVVILKCYLSYMNGSHLTNKLSCEQRILEILELTAK